MRSMSEIQGALRARGFNPGPLTREGLEDGIFGRKTAAAIESMQKRNGRPVTGRPDAELLAMLFPGEPDAKVPQQAATVPWFLEAGRLLGLRETAGKASNPKIIGWATGLASRVGAWIANVYKSDDIAWCGLFVGHCIAAALPKEGLPSNPLGARAWLKFGRPLDRPAIGAVAVFWRVSRNSGLGHVGFYAGESADGKILIRGGNQQDKVSEVWISKDRLLGYRWPLTAPLPIGGPVKAAAAGGPLSSNEA